jgi:hypothetical protein
MSLSPEELVELMYKKGLFGDKPAPEPPKPEPVPAMPEEPLQPARRSAEESKPPEPQKKFVPQLPKELPDESDFARREEARREEARREEARREEARREEARREEARREEARREEARQLPVPPAPALREPPSASSLSRGSPPPSIKGSMSVASPAPSVRVASPSPPHSRGRARTPPPKLLPQVALARGFCAPADILTSEQSHGHPHIIPCYKVFPFSNAIISHHNHADTPTHVKGSVSLRTDVAFS